MISIMKSSSRSQNKFYRKKCLKDVIKVDGYINNLITKLLKKFKNKKFKKSIFQ